MYSAFRKNAITLSGPPASGKSTIKKILAERLGYESYSMGGLVEKLAKESGQTKEDFYRKNAGGKLDEDLDAYQQNLGEQKNKFILDSRLGFYFVPQSFKVFLPCDLREAAQRAYRARKDNVRYATIKQARQTISERDTLEKENYAKIYGIPNFHSPFHYDLMINTTSKKPEDIARQILKGYKKYEKVTEEIELVCWGLQMAVANKFTYFSGPITGSKLLYETMRTYNVSRKEDLPKDVYDKIRQENVARSKRLEEVVKTKRESPALLPGKLGSADIWSQRDYIDLSKEIIRFKATEMVFEDGWQYSNGCVEELLLALQLKKPIFDQQEKLLEKEKAIGLLATAVEEIHKLPAECPKLDFLLEQLKRA